MGKILSLLLGLAVLMGIAYWTMNHRNSTSVSDESAKQQLDNVRGAAKQIEADAQLRADEAAKRAVIPE